MASVVSPTLPAFFSDVEYEVSVVKSGYRVTLACNMIILPVEWYLDPVRKSLTPILGQADLSGSGPWSTQGSRADDGYGRRDRTSLRPVAETYIL